MIRYTVCFAGSQTMTIFASLKKFSQIRAIVIAL